MTGGTDVSDELQRWESPPVRLYAERLVAALRHAWAWVRVMQTAARARQERRSLRVAESVSLGDKRAVYVVEVDGQRLLLGASAAGVTLLSQLPPPKEIRQHAVEGPVFAEVLQGCEGTGSVKRKTRRSVAREAA